LNIRFKVNKRFNVFVTVFACAAAIWMMVVRFDYPIEKVFEILWVSVVFLVGLILLAVPFAFILRVWNARHDQSSVGYGKAIKKEEES